MAEPRPAPALWRRAAVRLMERFRRTHALRLLPELEASQWWPHARLKELQLERLGGHLRFCRDEVPYWRDLFRERGFDPDRFADPAELQALPLLTKKMIQDAGDAMLPSSFGSRQPRPKSTSGSTGIPLNYYLDRPSHSFLWAQIWRAWAQVGYRPGRLHAMLSGGALLPDMVDFKQRLYMFLSGTLQLPSYHLTDETVDRYLDVLEKRGIDFLYAYPSSTELIARRLEATPGRPVPIRAIVTTSEVLAPAARERIERAFGCPIHDTYGCNDGGMYSFECDRHDGFHAAMESVFVEVVDQDGRQLPDGEVGRIVTSHFANKSHPFLRYVTGDLGALTREPCPCGRGLERVVKLQGRERDLVLTPDGRRIHGAFFNNFKPFYKSPWIESFQIHQPDRDSLTVRLTVHRPPSPGEEAFIVDEMTRGLGGLEVRVEIRDELELSAAGKFRVIISDVS